MVYFHSEAVPYVDIIYEGNKLPMPALPPISEFATEDEVSFLHVSIFICTLYTLIKSMIDMKK